MESNFIKPKQDCRSCELKSPLFCMLSEEELERVNESKLCVEFRKGEVIRKQGTYMSHVISVNKGLAKLYLEGQADHNAIIKLVKPNNFIGGPGIYLDKLHHYSLAALTKTNVCFIDVDLFTELIEANHVFAREFMKDFSKGVLSVYSRLLLLTQKHMHGRMADILLYLCNDIFASQKFEMLLSNQDLADISGVARETASKIIREFRHAQIIHYNNIEMEILDYDALVRISKTG